MQYKCERTSKLRKIENWPMPLKTLLSLWNRADMSCHEFTDKEQRNSRDESYTAMHQVSTSPLYHQAILALIFKQARDAVAAGICLWCELVRLDLWAVKNGETALWFASYFAVLRGLHRCCGPILIWSAWSGSLNVKPRSENGLTQELDDHTRPSNFATFIIFRSRPVSDLNTITPRISKFAYFTREHARYTVSTISGGRLNPQSLTCPTAQDSKPPDLGLKLLKHSFTRLFYGFPSLGAVCALTMSTHRRPDPVGGKSRSKIYGAQPSYEATGK